MDLKAEAEILIHQHGRRSQQFVVDQIAAAIRRNDLEYASQRSLVLREIETMLHSKTD